MNINNLRLLTLTLALILFTGCATNKAFQQEIDSRIGTSIEDLVQDVGKPSHTPANSIDGSYEWYYKGTAQKQGQENTVTCRVSFYVDSQGIISRTKSEGYYCGMKSMPSFEANSLRSATQ